MNRFLKQEKGLCGSGEGYWISESFKSKTPFETIPDSPWMKTITVVYVLRYVRWIWCLNLVSFEQSFGSQSHYDIFQ